MIELKKIFISGNLLNYSIESLSDTINIPYFCLPLNSRKYKFFAEFANNNKREVTKLVARLLDQKSEKILEEILIKPYYNKVIKDSSGQQDIIFSLAMTPKERKDTYCLIINHHYIPKPSQGLMLIAKLQSNEGPVIGCVVIDTLTYANPKGREQLANHVEKYNDIARLCGVSPNSLIWHKVPELYKKYKQEQPDKETIHSSIADFLKIAWISRVVVDPEYQGKGVGQLMLKELANVVLKYRGPTAENIEVIASYKKIADISDDPYAFDAEKNLFVKSKFHVFNGNMTSSKLVFTDDDIPKPSIKKYFFASVHELLEEDSTQ